MSVKELRDKLLTYGGDTCHGCKEKHEFIDRIISYMDDEREMVELQEQIDEKKAEIASLYA
jgi:hypothetical protein